MKANGEKTYLNEDETRALVEIKGRLSVLFDIRQYILFGSKARGNAAPDSDVDLLIVTASRLDHNQRHIISHEIFEVNLNYDTLFSFVVVDETEWNSRLYSYYPFHANIQKDGVSV